MDQIIIWETWWCFPFFCTHIHEKNQQTNKQTKNKPRFQKNAAGFRKTLREYAVRTHILRILNLNNMMIGEEFIFWDPCFICVLDTATKMGLLPIHSSICQSVSSGSQFWLLWKCWGFWKRLGYCWQPCIRSGWTYWDTSYNFLRYNEADHSPFPHKRYCTSKTYAALCHY